MYAIKAQKKLADIEKKEKEERRIEALGGLKIVQGAVSPDVPSDGPQGAKKKVKYVGSFKVFPPPGLSGRAMSDAIADFVWERASGINPKRISNPISGTLVVNRYGIRLYKDKKIFMSYPIKKISYCTAVPRNAVFAMVTRNIQHQPDDLIYCHVFGLSNAEQASELSQFMSHAFKLAVTQSTLRRSLGDDKKKDKKAKVPWEVLKRKEKKKSPSASPAPQSKNLSVPSPSSSKDKKSSNRSSSYLNPPPPPFAPGYSPEPERRSNSLVSSDVTVEGLEAEIMYLEQQIAEAESRLQSMSPSSDAALEMTIQLSANEDLLQVRRQQLYNLQQMPPSSIPPPNAPVLFPPPAIAGVGDQYLQPPSYNDVYGAGGAVGGDVGFDDESILETAEWYQAGLPREIVMDILAYQPPGSFIVRDSTSNPGCYALSFKSPDGHIMHYLIGKDHGGYFLQGCNTRHRSLLSLITHHATVVEFLPTTLSLGSTNLLANPTQSESQPEGANGGLYPFLGGSDSDNDMDDEEMVEQLERMQLINP